MRGWHTIAWFIPMNMQQHKCCMGSCLPASATRTTASERESLPTSLRGKEKQIFSRSQSRHRWMKTQEELYCCCSPMCWERVWKDSFFFCFVLGQHEILKHWFLNASAPLLLLRVCRLKTLGAKNNKKGKKKRRRKRRGACAFILFTAVGS